jgi:hypothetical protein
MAASKLVEQQNIDLTEESSTSASATKSNKEENTG